MKTTSAMRSDRGGNREHAASILHAGIMTTTGIVVTPGSGRALIAMALGALEWVRPAAVLGAMTHLVLASAAARVGPR